MEKTRRVERARIKLLQHLRTIGNFPMPQKIESFQHRVHIDDFKAYNAMKQKQARRTFERNDSHPMEGTGRNIKQKMTNKATPKTLTKKPEHTNSMNLQLKRQMIPGKPSQEFHRDDKQENEDFDWGCDVTIKDIASIVPVPINNRPRKKARKQFVNSGN